MLCRFFNKNSKIDVILNYIELLNNVETISYHASLNQTPVPKTEHIQSIKNKVAQAIRDMEAQLEVNISFEGFEWLGEMLELELRIRRVAPGSSFGTVIMRAGKRSSSLMLAVPLLYSVLNQTQKIIAPTPLLTAIKKYYAKNSSAIDHKLEILVLKMFNDPDYAAREIARNTKIISQLHGPLIPVIGVGSIRFI